MSPRNRSASVAFRLSYWVPALAVVAALVFLAWLMAGPAAAQEGNAGTGPANVMLFADGIPAEGGDPVTVVAGLRNPARPEGVIVTLTTAGTATSGGDYTMSAATVNIAPGATAGLATITVTDDGFDDDGETIILSAGTDAGSLAVTTLTLTILDNDDATLTITPDCDPFGTSDYDRDNDRFIEVCNLAQFNAIRWDVNGDGHNVYSSGYRAAYPNATGGMGCPWGSCKGYELTANLDFDTNANGRADAGDWNGGQGWTPFAFRAVLRGNGRSISNLSVATPNSGAGLFSTLSQSGVIRDVRLKSVDIAGDVEVGGLVGRSNGTIRGSSVSGSVSGSTSVGGLVGAAGDTSHVIASVATASVTGSQDNAGGLVGRNNGNISTSYAIGKVSGSAANIGGLVGRGESNLVSDSYFDTVTSGQTSSAGGVGKTSSELQQPTGYVGIYADWNVDVDGDELLDKPWCFGTASDYPTLSLRGVLCPNTPASVPANKVDYDTDDDGLIEVSNLAQLSAIRWNTGGDGRSIGDSRRYSEAYPNAADFMGCAVRGNSYFGRLCKGYELTTDLDFDTNGNGWLDSWDWNGGRRWEPIRGGHGVDFGAVFDGNGYTIRNLFVEESKGAGLFRSLERHGVIRNVRLESVHVDGSLEAGGLVGSNNGTISGSSVSGSVWGSTSVGGLVGSAGSSSIIAGSHSTVSVDRGYERSGGRSMGGLVGSNEGIIRGSYAAGAVSAGEANNVGGLVGYSDPRSFIIASYAVGEVSSSGQNIGGLVGHPAGTVIASYWNTVLSRASGNGGVGKNTTELQEPTRYAGIYAGWNVDLDGDNSVDDPWDFGTSSEYPVLKHGGFSVAEQRALMPTVPAVAVANGIEDVTFVNESGTREVSLSGVFSDADGDELNDLTVTARSSDEAVATVSVAADYSTLTVTAKRWSTATITVTAADGSGGTADDSFTVTVKGAPLVLNPLADVTGLVEGTTQDVSLSLVFFDPGSNARDLTFTATSSEEAIATVTVASDGRTLTVAGVAEGTATITVTAEDADGNWVSDSFDVTVSEVREPEPPEQATLPGPVVNLELTDTADTITVTWEAPESGGVPNRYIAQIKPEGGGKGATKRPKAGMTTVTFRNLEAGKTYEVWVRAQNDAGKGERVHAGITLPGDGQQQQQATPNRAPAVSAALGDVTLINESGARQVSLSGTFDDADEDDLTITAASSDETKATVSVSSDYSILTVSAHAQGTATITVTADDSQGGTVDDTFAVTVKAAPVVASAMGDVSGLEEGATQDQSLSGVFSDADGDPLTVTSISSDDAKATVTVATDHSELKVTGVAEGTATITVTAQDSDGNRVSDAFDVSVVTAPEPPVNQSPTVSGAIADASIVNESGTRQVSLSGVFDDADNDDLTITATSLDETVATVNVAADYATLTVSARARGTATITVSATDRNGGTASDTFTVTVKAAPVVASAMGDVSGLEEGATQDQSLSGVFSDADGDPLTISASSSDDAVVAVFVSPDNTLAILGIAAGSETITVTAQDSDGNLVSDTFDVSVVKKYAELIAQMREWRNDPEWVDNKEHTDRWDRALLALGETVEDTSLTPMTAAEAQELADRGWQRWERVAEALKEIEGG